jgi:hypothetical protein
MCRSIKTLRGPTPATEDEVRAAALQFVRKVSGFRAPSEKNAQAFDLAVQEVSRATDRLLEQLPASKATGRAPRPRRYPSRNPNGVEATTPR